MKNAFVLRFSVILLAVLFNLNVQAQGELYGTAGLNETFGTALTHSNNFFYIAGTSDGKATLSKIPTAATHLISAAGCWTKEFPGPNGETIFWNDVQESHSGNVILAGTTSAGPGQSNMHLMVMEIHAGTGAILQSRRLSLPGNNRLLNVKIVLAKYPAPTTCQPLEYIVSARRFEIGGTIPQHTWLTKLDFTLNVVWSNLYQDGNHTENYGLTASLSGGAIVAGVTMQSGTKGFILEVAANGNVGPYNGYSASNGGFLYISNITREYSTTGTSSNLLICGAFKPTGDPNYQGFVSKVSSTSFNPVSGQGVWYDDPTDFETFFVGLTQKAASNGAICFADIASVGAGFEPRIFCNSTANLSTGIKSHRDLGGNIPCCQISYPLTVNRTNQVVATDGRPGTIGGGLSDAFLYTIPFTPPVGLPILSDACSTAVNISFQPLTVNKVTLSITKVAVQPATTTHCGQFALTWTQDQNPPCNPYGNKPSGKTVNGPTINPDQEFTVISQSQNPSPETSDRAAVETEKIENVTFSIFPNPASQTVEINFQKGQGQDQTISIYDLTGKELKTETVNDAEQTTLDLSDLPQGIYLVKVGESPAQKLTKI